MKVSQLSGRRHRQAAQFVKLHLDQRVAFTIGPDQAGRYDVDFFGKSLIFTRVLLCVSLTIVI